MAGPQPGSTSAFRGFRIKTLRPRFTGEAEHRRGEPEIAFVGLF
jgi:hypothetical protein